jgi:antitoxin component HigA of HigAB toxin-antitoxin module
MSCDADSPANEAEIVTRQSQEWPLRTKADYRAARSTVERLAVKGEEALTEVERDQLEIFTVLMEKYEEEYHHMDRSPLTAMEFLTILVRESEMTASDLGRLLGDRSLGYKVLAGERKLSKAHIKTLSEHFKVDAGAFL